MLDIPMAVDDKRDGANSLSAVRLRNFQEHRIWLACFRLRAAHTAKARNKQAGQPYWTESVSEQPSRTAPRRAGSVRKTGACVRTSIACRHVAMCLGAWSSGRIRASGARGRGFDSRSSPSHVAHVAARAAGQSRDARTPNAGQAAARQVRRGHEGRGGLPLLRLDDQGGRLEALLPGDVRRRRGRGPPPLVRRQVRRARRGPREGLHRARQHRPDGH